MNSRSDLCMLYRIIIYHSVHSLLLDNFSPTLSARKRFLIVYTPLFGTSFYWIKFVHNSHYHLNLSTHCLRKLMLSNCTSLGVMFTSITCRCASVTFGRARLDKLNNNNDVFVICT